MNAKRSPTQGNETLGRRDRILSLRPCRCLRQRYIGCNRNQADLQQKTGLLNDLCTSPIIQDNGQARGTEAKSAASPCGLLRDRIPRPSQWGAVISPRASAMSGTVRTFAVGDFDFAYGVWPLPAMRRKASQWLRHLQRAIV